MSGLRSQRTLLPTISISCSSMSPNTSVPSGSAIPPQPLANVPSFVQLKAEDIKQLEGTLPEYVKASSKRRAKIRNNLLQTLVGAKGIAHENIRLDLKKVS